MSKFPHSHLNVGSLADGTPVRDKAKGRSHLLDHPEAKPHLAALLLQVRLEDFDARGNFVREFELDVELDSEVVAVSPEAQCFFALRPNRGLGRVGTDSFSARPSRFVEGGTPLKTRKLKVVLWRKPADDEEDQIVVVTTCYPGDAAPEPWSFGLTEVAYQQAKAYWEGHAFVGRSADGLTRSSESGLYWQHNPSKP